MKLDVLKREDNGQFGDRVPPNQRLTSGWPVFTSGSTPQIDTKEWQFTVSGAVEEELTFSWDEFNALAQATIATDIHCVTGWSKLDNEWTGVPFADLMARVRPLPHARYVLAQCYGGYTTNLTLADLQADDVLFAHSHGGEPLPPEHGGPMRLVVPHLYFWKSAKWVRGLMFTDEDQPGFWEQYGYHNRGDPWKEERHS